MEKKIRIGIAEDHVIVRKGIVEIINDFNNMEVILEADNGRILVDKLNDGVEIDIAILDLEMPEMDGYETAEFIYQNFPGIKSICLSQHSTDRHIVHFIDCGGAGYLLKNVSPDELKEALWSTYKLGYYINDSVTSKMLRGLNKRYRYKPGFGNDEFTETEHEVLLEMCKGLSSAEISKILNRSVRTIDNHRARMMEKLGVNNSVQLVVAALKKGILELEQID